MKLRLLKDWLNVDDQYKAGQYLEANDATGEKLINDGIAEQYTPKAGDVVVIDPTATGGNFAKEAMTNIVKEILNGIRKDAKDKGQDIFGTPVEDSQPTNGGYKEFWQFAADVFKAEVSHGRNVSEQLRNWDKATRKTAGHMAEGDDSQGGYLVPAEFRNQLLEVALEAAIIRPRATVIPMQTNTVNIPYVNDTSHASSTHGGIIIYRPGEAAQKTASKPTFGQVGLTLKKLVGLVYVSDELLEDSPISIQPLIGRMFGEAISWQEEEDFINGTGAGQALGILNAPCIIAQTAEVGQDADTIVSENIDAMWSRLHPRSQARAIWMANNDAWPQLARLERAVGTGGSTAGLVQSIPNSPQMGIYGRPLFLTEHCQTLGDEGDIILADWSQYLIGQKAGASAIQTASSMHLKFDYDQTAFRFVLRYDGQPWWPSDVTPAHSTSTLSPFVTLEART